MTRPATDPDVHARIVASKSPHTVDGYWPGEPKYLNCPACSAWVRLTAEPSPGWEDMNHDVNCPYQDE